MNIVRAIFVVLAVSITLPTWAGDGGAQMDPAQTREAKRRVVAANMQLSEQEAQAFWPVYEDYQNELAQIDVWLGNTVKAYADAYNQGEVPDATAKRLFDNALNIEEAETQLKRSYLSKLEKAIPTYKAVRYLQIETKIRAAVRYKLSESIPLVE